MYVYKQSRSYLEALYNKIQLLGIPETKKLKKFGICEIETCKKWKLDTNSTLKLYTGNNVCNPLSS